MFSSQEQRGDDGSSALGRPPAAVVQFDSSGGKVQVPGSPGYTPPPKSLPKGLGKKSTPGGKGQSPGKGAEGYASTAAASQHILQGKISELARVTLNSWRNDDAQLKATEGQTNNQKPMPHMKQGQMEFTGLKGHRASYLIAPPEMEDPEQILMHMFDPQSKMGWNLKPPNLMLYALGGRDHYMHWLATSQSGPEVWGSEDHKKRDRFRSRMTEIAGGVCQAVTECGGWFDFGTGGRGGMSEVLKDGLKAHWAAKNHLAGMKDDTVVLAVRLLESTEFHEDFVKCSAELSDPDAAPDKLKQRLMYPSVDHLLFPEKGIGGAPPKAGGKEKDEDRDLTGFDELSGEDDADDEEQTEVQRMERELVEVAGGDDSAIKQAYFKLNNRFLSNCITHLVLVQNDQLLQRMGSALKALSTRAIIFANGRDELIQPGIEGQALNAATAGTPVVVLHHTGGAAEKLGRALQEKRATSGIAEGPAANVSNRYQIPDNVNVDNFLLLSTSSDSVEKVIDKLTLVLSSVQDDEMREVGYLQAERQRLLQAWQMHAHFHYHATKQRKAARYLYFSLLFCQFTITCVSVLHIYLVSLITSSVVDADEGVVRANASIPADLLWTIVPVGGVSFSALALVLCGLPLLSAMVQAIFSKFNPLSKYASLEQAALRVRTEIYMYRTRTLDYRPRNRQQMDIMKQIARVQKQTMMLMQARSEGGDDGSGGSGPQGAQRVQSQENLALGSKGGDDEETAHSAVETRRATFAENLDKIHSEAIMSDLGNSALASISEKTFKAVIRSMYGHKANEPTMPEEQMKHAFESVDAAQQKQQSQKAKGATGMAAKKDKTPSRRTSFNTSSTPATGKKAKVGDVESAQIDPILFDPNSIDILRDDGFALVTAEDYVTFRLKPQIIHYQALSPKLNRVSSFVQITSYFLTAVTTFLALVQLIAFVPIPTAAIALITGVSDFEQLTSRLRNVNQCLMQLENLLIWWESLSMVEKRLPTNKEYLVKVAEENMNAEVSAFIKSAARQGKPRVEEEEEEEKKKKE